MIFRYLLIIISTIVISLNSIAYEVRELNIGHESAIFGYNSLSNLKNLAKVSDETLKKNEKKSSDEALRLVVNQRKLKRYIYIREAFENCIALKQKNNNIFDPTKMDLVLKDIEGTPAIRVNCREDIDQYSGFNQFKGKIESLIKKIELSEVQKKLSEIAIENVVETFIYLKMKTGEKLDSSDLVKEFCFDSCDEEKLKQLIKKIF